MSTVEYRRKTTVRHEYAIPKPANWAEVGKAIAMAHQEIKDAGRDPSYDDAAWFDSDDDHVILYWEEEA